jgi:CRISPR-associated protein Cst2
MSRKNSITLTVVANMTSNYSEGLGNIASVQKVYTKGRVHAMRSRESMKNALMVSSGMYDDLQTKVDGATQKMVDKDVNVATCRALEGGYMSTGKITYIRKSSFYMTDAIACESFVNETRFHNNLYLATNYANANNINLQENAKATGLMPYQYEYDKSLKLYSITIDLDMIGKDENFEAESSKDEKIYRVNAILSTVESLSLIVKGNLDNAEPIFVVGGFSDRKTHYFENVVEVKGSKLLISPDLKDRLSRGYNCGVLKSGIFSNENEIQSEINPSSITAFFDNLREEVKIYFKNN